VSARKVKGKTPFGTREGVDIEESGTLVGGVGPKHKVLS